MALAFAALLAASAAAQTPKPTPAACGPCIRSEEEFLAGDALRGRGSGTEDEHLAAAYIGSELRRYGIEPAGDDGSYVQTVPITTPTVAAPPVVSFTVNGQETKWTHGQQVLVLSAPGAPVSGTLQKLDSAASNVAVQKGAVVLVRSLEGCAASGCNAEFVKILEQGAAALLAPASGRMRDRWQQYAARTPQISEPGGPGPRGAGVALNDDALKALSAAPDGTAVQLDIRLGEPKITHTWNAVGMLRGSEAKQAILLSAHLDHLGVGQPVNGDAIYNGADDDASGCVAVLEMAHALGQGPKPKRTVLFVMFGSEERGGAGSRYWLDHPTVPLPDLVANLEFEMIGRADPAVKPDELWLTGWERSDLGPELAKHGAKLVGDPHPQQNFFARSDNIQLARRAVVAQTVSSYGLHADYHRPSDDVSHLDFAHMEQAIGSMIEPVRWLVDSDFVPAWAPGKKP